MAEFAAQYLTHNDGTDSVTNTNILLGVYQPQCENQLESVAFRGAQRSAGGNVLAIASLPASEFHVSLEGDACVEVFFYYMDSRIDKPHDSTGMKHP